MSGASLNGSTSEIIMLVKSRVKDITSSTFEKEVQRTGDSMLLHKYLTCRAWISENHPNAIKDIERMLMPFALQFIKHHEGTRKMKLEAAKALCNTFSGRTRDALITELYNALSKAKWTALLFDEVQHSDRWDIAIPYFSQIIINHSVASMMNKYAPLEAYEEWQKLPHSSTVYQCGEPMGDNTQLWSLSVIDAVEMAQYVTSDSVELRRAIIRKDETYVVLRGGKPYLLSPFALTKSRAIHTAKELPQVSTPI